MSSNISYAKLMDVYMNVTPYRNTNEYPYDVRSHRHKFFVPVKKDGEIEFHLNYYWSSQEEYYSLADYEQMLPYLNKRQRNHYYYNEGREGIPYMTKYRRINKPYGIVRKDNTLEILIERHMHQGVRMHISAQLGWRKPYFMQEAGSGGIIFTDRYRQAGRSIKYPIFKGFRFNIDTFELHESSRFKIDVKVMDRKKANQVIKQEQDKLNMIKMFYSFTDRKTLCQDMKEKVVGEHGEGVLNSQENFIRLAKQAWDTDPIASTYFYMLAYYIYNIYWVIRYDREDARDPMDYYQKLLPKLKRHLKQSADIFKHETYWDFEKKYPMTPWGATITKMDGTEVNQIYG